MANGASVDGKHVTHNHKDESMKMLSTSDVLDGHLKSFADYDVEGVVADYSSDAVLFVPSGTLKGPDSIKPFFQALISEFGKPGSSFTMQLRSIEGDHAYILWSAETADNSYEFATDTFFVRDRKIVAQSFAAKIRPKH